MRSRWSRNCLRSGAGAEIIFLINTGSVSDPDPHTDMPPESGSTWTGADPDPGGKKSKK